MLLHSGPNERDIKRMKESWVDKKSILTEKQLVAQRFNTEKKPFSETEIDQFYPIQDNPKKQLTLTC